MKTQFNYITRLLKTSNTKWFKFMKRSQTTTMYYEQIDYTPKFIPISI